MLFKIILLFQVNILIGGSLYLLNHPTPVYWFNWFIQINHGLFNNWY